MSEHPDDERLLTVRNLIAMVILLLFCLLCLLPYWIAVPEGRTGDIIANGSKVVETVLVLVLGFYFGDSTASRRKDRAIQAATQANATLAANATPPAEPAASQPDAGAQ